MAKYRLLYLFTLFCVTPYYIVYPFWISQYLLTIVIIFPAFDFVLSVSGCLNRRLTLHAPAVVNQGDSTAATITPSHKNKMPAGQMSAQLIISHNEKTTREKIIISQNPDDFRIVVPDTSKTGIITLSLKRLRAVSLMGLFSLRVSLNCSRTVLVMPYPVEPITAPALPQGDTLTPKPGGGFAEDYDVRQYRKGDPIKAVHWKLSAKLDELKVKEALETPPHYRLIICQTWHSAKERDLILARLRWMSEYLLKHDLPYFLRMGTDGIITEIKSEQDLHQFLTLSLTGSNLLTPVKTPSAFTWVFTADASEYTP